MLIVPLAEIYPKEPVAFAASIPPVNEPVPLEVTSPLAEISFINKSLYFLAAEPKLCVLVTSGIIAPPTVIGLDPDK